MPCDDWIQEPHTRERDFDYWGEVKDEVMALVGQYIKGHNMNQIGVYQEPFDPPRRQDSLSFHDDFEYFASVLTSIKDSIYSFVAMECARMRYYMDRSKRRLPYRRQEVPHQGTMTETETLNHQQEAGRDGKSSERRATRHPHSLLLGRQPFSAGGRESF
ncbi:hypothetical protein GWK47_025656 [Chionoecetes opilio]|uniref:Uncharacterized protein n=1 Tax=Chionoecetes opilio TaxID=41210 RepID=A0A8J8WF52_CHIOP|nr:hypothetical protein GWK47_025656 [Chionoecetes opilio]